MIMISNNNFRHIMNEAIYNQIALANETIPLFDVTNLWYGLLYNVSELWPDFNEYDLIDHIKSLGYVHFSDPYTNGLCFRHVDIPDAGIEIIIPNLKVDTYLLTSHTIPGLVCYKGFGHRTGTQIYIKGIRNVYNAKFSKNSF